MKNALSVIGLSALVGVAAGFACKAVVYFYPVAAVPVALLLCVGACLGVVAVYAAGRL